jgi:hypothetical protein
MGKDALMSGFCLLGEPRDAMIQWVTTLTGYEPDPRFVYLDDIRTMSTTIEEQPYKLIFIHRTSWRSYEWVKKLFSRPGTSASMYNCIICFDKSNSHSFEYVRKWYDLIPKISKSTRHSGKYYEREKIAIAGLVTGTDVISQEQGQQLAKKLNGIYGEFQPSDQQAITSFIEAVISFFMEKKS